MENDLAHKIISIMELLADDIQWNENNSMAENIAHIELFLEEFKQSNDSRELVEDYKHKILKEKTKVLR